MRDQLSSIFIAFLAILTSSSAAANVPGADADIVCDEGELFFTPRQAYYAVNKQPFSDVFTVSIILTDSEEPCHTLFTSSQPLQNALVFATSDASAGGHALNMTACAWGSEPGWGMAMLVQNDAQGNNQLDARSSGEPSIFPYGEGVTTAGALRLIDTPGGVTLRGAFQADFGSDGYEKRKLHGTFTAQQCRLEG